MQISNESFTVLLPFKIYNYCHILRKVYFIIKILTEDDLMIGDRICELRKDNGMTQDDLAKYLNVTRASISNYEKGVNEPSLQIIIKLSKLFNVSSDYLLELTKEKYNLNFENKDNRELIFKIFNILKDYKIMKR